MRLMPLDRTVIITLPADQSGKLLWRTADGMDGRAVNFHSFKRRAAISITAATSLFQLLHAKHGNEHH